MTDAALQYRVLARKYRPQTFAELIGQEALTRTLANAFRTGRVHHAFVLTGVRGVGKTTTARIIARGLNCVGPDGAGGPTVAPCGACEPCRSIAAGRSVDVIEMDAASRTGVADIRELIDGVRYSPASCRRKVYIVDEVHMLSTSAFNALLKTLEEPPPHATFIFATTEVRKLPVTVLSRCMRFDLRRVEIDALIAHLDNICAKEKVTAAPDALRLIARAAEGSVRDALSLLDQAIAHGGDAPAAAPEAADAVDAVETAEAAEVAEAAATVSAEAVRDMLGLADRAVVIDLFEALMRGRALEALDLLRGQYDRGADPAVVLRDLLDLTHWLTRLKLSPAAASDPGASEEERDRGRAMAEGLTVRSLSQTWRLLLAALPEVQSAPSALAAADMALIRIAHVADLPSPEEAARVALDRDRDGGDRDGGDGARQSDAPRQYDNARQSDGAAPRAVSAPRPARAGGARGAGGARAQATAPTVDAAPAATPAPATPAPALSPMPESFEAVAALAGARRDIVLKTRLEREARLVSFAPGRIEINPVPGAGRDLAGAISAKLSQWTGRRWIVTISNEAGAETLDARARAAADDARARALAHPLAQAALKMFPDAIVTVVRPPSAADDADGPIPFDPDAAEDADGDADAGADDEADGDGYAAALNQFHDDVRGE